MSQRSKEQDAQSRRMPMGAAGQQHSVKSALRTLDLIEYVVAHPAGVAAQRIADALGIPMSSLPTCWARWSSATICGARGGAIWPGRASTACGTVTQTIRSPSA